MRLEDKILIQLCECNRLCESLTYDQLVAATQDNWSKRLETVRYVETTPPKTVVLRDGGIDLSFNFHTAGSPRSHYGYIKFFPRLGIMDKIKKWWNTLKEKIAGKSEVKVPPNVLTGDDIRKLNCEVSCDCEDFRYRMEVANKRHGASRIIHSNGAQPVKTNPNRNPGLCKHLLACLAYLSSDMNLTAGGEPDKL